MQRHHSALDLSFLWIVEAEIAHLAEELMAKMT
jgi:hypothetical protein